MNMKMNVTSSCVARSCVCRLNTRVPTYTFTPLWFSTGGMGALCVYRACIVRIQIVRVQTVSTLTDSGMCLDIQSTVFGRMYICVHMCACVYICMCVHVCDGGDGWTDTISGIPPTPPPPLVTAVTSHVMRACVCHMSHTRVLCHYMLLT